MDYLNLNGISAGFLGEARNVLDVQTEEREDTKVAEFSDGECFILEINQESIAFIEKHGESYTDSDKILRTLNITSIFGEENAACMCAILKDSDKINSEMNGNKALHFKILMANEFTKYIKDEISKVATGNEDAKILISKKREHDIELCSVLSWTLQQARDIYYFLANDSLFAAYDNAGGNFQKGEKNNIGANHIDPEISPARKALQKEAWNTLIKTESLIKQVILSKNYFYSATKNTVVPYSENNLPEPRLSEKTFRNRIESLLSLRGVSEQDYEKFFTEEQKKNAKEKALEKISRKFTFVEYDVTSSNTDTTLYAFSENEGRGLFFLYAIDKSKEINKDSTFDIPSDGEEKYKTCKLEDFTKITLKRQTIKLGENLTEKELKDNAVLLYAKKSEYNIASGARLIQMKSGKINCIKYEKMKGSKLVEPKEGEENYENFKKEYKKLCSPEHFSEMRDLVRDAIHSIESAAIASGISTADQRNIMFDSTLEKINTFRDKPITSLDEINSDYFILRNLIDKNCEGDVRKEHLYQYLDECTYTRIAILNKAAVVSEEESKTESTSAEYIGDADEFTMDVVSILPLGKVINIDLFNQNSRNKKSWFKRLYDAQYELMGYHLPASAKAVCDSYKKTRNLEAALIKKAGELIDVPFRIVDPNFNLGHNISQLVANELQRPADEINPKLISLEEDLRNPAKWARGHDPLKKHIDRDDLRKTYRYKIVDKTYTEGEKQEAEEQKQIKKMSKYLKNTDESAGNRQYESINMSWLNLNPINEDFAVAGGFACTPGGYEQCGEVVTPNTDFNYPGVISSMGDAHAPTPDQTPFNGNEKTSAKDSGSADFGSYKRYKENKKKHKSKLLK